MHCKTEMCIHIEYAGVGVKVNVCVCMCVCVLEHMG